VGQAAPADQRQNWTFFNAASETLEGADDGHQDPTPPTSEEASKGEDDHPWRRPIALSVTGMLLILGMQLAFFGPRPPWAATKASLSTREATSAPATTTAETPASSLVSLASTAWSATSDNEYDSADKNPEADSNPRTPAPIPQAPAIRLNALSQVLPGAAKPAAAAKDDASTLGGFLRRWSTAHDEVQSRLQSGLRVSRLNQLFSPARMTPNGGVTETRMAIAGAANFIRVYRQQREAIDREFQDSFVVMTRENKLSSSEIRRWYAKVTPKEVPALATLTSTILTGMDSLLGVLDAQAGAYQVEKNSIRFEDPSAARAYGELREEIAKAVDVAKAAGGSDSTGPMLYLLEAIGSTRLPKES
jgi:hypothetical protein